MFFTLDTWTRVGVYKVQKGSSHLYYKLYNTNFDMVDLPRAINLSETASITAHGSTYA